MGSRLTVRVPEDFLLARDVCSYGYFLLAPNHWDPGARTLTRPIALPGGNAVCTIAQPAGTPGAPLRVTTDRSIARSERAPLVAALTRMLRLDETPDDLARFHRKDRRWKPSGRGRLFRSPTLFEDVVKTVTSCNVAWPSTIKMNERLCAVVDDAFPSAAKLARRRPSTLRARCSVGYRDKRLVDLARLFRAGEVDQDALEDPAVSDDDAFAALLELPGIGPYAAGNIMQLLGRYSRLAIDTETERHARAVLGFTETGRAMHQRIEAHYERFGDQKFRSYWFELWDFYESLRGPAWTWRRETTGRTFTSAQLK